MKVIILLLLLIVSACEPIEPLEREETIKFNSAYVFTDMKRFIVYDSLGNPMKRCNTYEQAMTYKIMCQRYDWTIKEVRK